MIEHKHLIVRATVNNPPYVQGLVRWFPRLIKDLGMKLLSGPHVDYVNMPGNRGVTGVCIIETSHLAMHVWDEQNPALLQLDVYTCGALDPNIVLEALEDFSPESIEFKYLDREHGLKELSVNGQS
jgi:S-adenosylmethionine/arginine decarboxylase-like enzyme